MMIDTRELRIGNLLSFEGDTWTVTSIPDDSNYYNDFNPIPLTEEWLLRFGCEKLLGDEWNYRLPIGAIYIRFRVYKAVYSNLGGIYLGKHIQYVHQLQNLYFALTGEELKLNDK